VLAVCPLPNASSGFGACIPQYDARSRSPPQRGMEQIPALRPEKFKQVLGEARSRSRCQRHHGNGREKDTKRYQQCWAYKHQCLKNFPPTNT
jgi:hypothetical protein